MADRELDNQRVVVIGGSSGIGFAVARRSREDGAQVIVHLQKVRVAGRPLKIRQLPNRQRNFTTKESMRGSR